MLHCVVAQAVPDVLGDHLALCSGSNIPIRMYYT